MSVLRAAAGRCRWFPVQYSVPAVSLSPSQREVCSWALSRTSGLLTLNPAAGLQVEAAGCLTAWLFPWSQQQVRTKKRGTEYQPKTIKRLRTHGWQKRVSTRGGIEVILRRMLKGRASLTH
ncbi:39S ribosomal protein L34, mitochondrial [Pristis pectinata]|uniref:39S ribosomal protein L34, mitochondrial n=1 Tax=Pristis pectinata TaxID=685728 RepID=UPI00223DD7DF|nr:39S ribosomal protein L34, mitochondrial [Pristis pectinata]